MIKKNRPSLGRPLPSYSPASFVNNRVSYPPFAEEYILIVVGQLDANIVEM